MSSAEYSCKLLKAIFCIQANSVDPDQTAPKGAVWSGSTLFATMTFKVTGRRQSRRQLLWLALYQDISCFIFISWEIYTADTLQFGICLAIFFTWCVVQFSVQKYVLKCHVLECSYHINPSLAEHDRGGWVRQRCCVSYITGASNWYWLAVGQGLLSLQQVRVGGECFYFFCFFTVIHFPFSSIPLFRLLYYLSSPFLWETTQNDPQGLTCR